MSLCPEAIQYIVNETEINARQIMATLELLVNEECTVPFIARYRKEKTGGIDEIQIRKIQECYDAYHEREKRRAYILETLKKQEVLTKQLEAAIVKATTLTELEDIYSPYKTKKKSKATLAREAGFGPLADELLVSKESFQVVCDKHKADDKAIAGAMDIIIELMAHDPEMKNEFREDYWKEAKLVASERPKAKEEKEYLKFKDYFEFSSPIKDLREAKAGHRFLAIKRGMSLKILKVEVSYPEDHAIAKIKKYFYGPEKNLGATELFETCAKKAFKTYIHSSLDLEIKTELKKLADQSAITVFSENLKNLLLGPYLGPKTVLAVDPGVRTGCKLALIDNTGKFIVDTVIYPHPPQNDTKGSAQVIKTFIEKFKVEYIAIGNGTFGRETLSFLMDNIPEIKAQKVKATLISESGASIYSASEIAAKEFPDKDVTVRGAISIARRFQDPLAELVKIDPKSIGVGQYQHDVNQVRLKKSLTGVVENCVNYVGVDLNTASAPLLSYISGIGPTLAENIVKTREKLGGYKNRADLLKVARFTPRVFEQAAGFLRIYDGSNPLDATFVHPERYQVLQKWCTGNSIKLDDLVGDESNLSKLASDSTLKNELGEFTFEDIIKSLKAPKQDPRTEFKSTEFRTDAKEIKDLKIGEWYPGLVTNITKFGAFVDIGIKENGLLHVSQMADKFVEDPLSVLKVGEEVKVRITDIDYDRKRISLSRKSDSPVERSVSTGQGNRPRHNGRPEKSIKMPRQTEIKNNPFADLKLK